MAEVSILKATYSEPRIEPLLEPLGGMAEFIEEGDRVLLKVNLLSAREPEKAVTTHPALVRAVALAVKEAGGQPYIGDSPSGTFSKRTLRKAYERSGLEDLANEDNIPLNYDTGIRKLDIPEYKKLKRSPFCNFVLDADKIIALPKLKTHSFQYMTLACKIMYGAIPGLTKAKYHAQFPSRDAFADMLLDVLKMVKPQLVIMDGITGMQGQGPASGDPVELGWVLASTDLVAMDIAICKALGIEPVWIPVLKRAKIRHLWPESIGYPLLSPEEITLKGFKFPNTANHLLTGLRATKKSPIITDKCIGCGDCEQICPKGAVEVTDEVAKINYLKCIQCFCCHEVCPEGAIRLGTVKTGK
ncbi:DUF362 domain-containing protein [Thermodesulfobacteriota bacterium]